MVQTLQTITFFYTEKLVDFYFNHRFNKNLDFWIQQAIKQRKTVLLALFFHFTSGD